MLCLFGFDSVSFDSELGIDSLDAVYLHNQFVARMIQNIHSERIPHRQALLLQSFRQSPQEVVATKRRRREGKKHGNAAGAPDAALMEALQQDFHAMVQSTEPVSTTSYTMIRKRLWHEQEKALERDNYHKKVARISTADVQQAVEQFPGVSMSPSACSLMYEAIQVRSLSPRDNDLA